MMKTKILIFTSAAILLMSLAIAAIVVTTSTGTSSFSVNESVDTAFFNITVNNTNAGQTSNITFVNITLPTEFTYVLDTNGTNQTLSNFTNVSNVLSWSNDTGYIINGSEKSFFWFNATVSTPGTYNITVNVTNITGSYPYNISVTVNDTTSPTAFIGTNPVNNYNSSSADVTFDIKCNDTYSVNDLVLYGNWSGSGWHANQTNASANNDSYWNVTVTGIADGVYEWAAYCNDSAGNNNLTANRTLTVDTTAPNASFGTNTTNTAILTNRTATFDIKCADTLTLPSTIQLWGNWSNGTSRVWHANNTNSSPVNNTFSNITVNFTADGTFTWAVWCNDSAGNGAWTSTNQTFTVGADPTASFGTLPINAYNSSSPNITIDYKCADPHDVDTMKLWGNWSNGTSQVWHANATNGTGLVNNIFSNTSLTNLADGSYKWAVWCNDSDNNTDWTDTNRTFTIDTTNPTASASCTATDITSGAAITCTCTATDVTSGIRTSTAISTPDTSQLSGTQTYTCSVTDWAGNTASSSTSYTISGGGGGGGGGGTTPVWTNTHMVTEEQFKNSFTKELSKKHRLRIQVNSENHHVGITGITATTATMEIASTPQTATLSIGDERKFEVTDDSYYDIYVKLNSITNNKANITVQSINELITVKSITEEEEREDAAEEKKKAEIRASKIYTWAIGIIVVIAIIIILNSIKKKKEKK